MQFNIVTLIIGCYILCYRCGSYGIRTYTRDDLFKLREEVKQMFYHAYDSYLKYAYPYDELRPISCDGIDTYGSYSLTLIDSLDTLAIMGNYSEFQRVVDILTAKPDFDSNINVSVFETNIRIIGGLLSAHLLSNKAGIKLEPGWPCNGPLLRLAEDVAKRLIVAFDTKTGMPYGTVNLRTGVPKGETTVTCTAGIGTFILEFGALSRLTGDPIYEEVVMNALYALFNHRSQLGLFGNHIDIDTGRWVAQDSGIGSGVDSYFEYLVKGAILLQKPELLEMFYEAKKSIDKFLKKDDWYMWVSMTKGHVTIPVFQSLEAYWPGVLSLIGDTSSAMQTLHNYHQVWLQYGFTPEFYYIPQTEAGTYKENYPLRPELIESIMYLYRATGDPFLLQAGEDILRSIQYSAKTPCGFATIKDVRDHKKEDRMESFFLAETTKYLYLLFDTDNFIHNQGQHGTVIETPNGECVIEAGGYIFNTEAHPIDPSALHCCHAVPNEQFDFADFNAKRDLYRGETVRELLKAPPAQPPSPPVPASAPAPAPAPPVPAPVLEALDNQTVIEDGVLTGIVQGSSFIGDGDGYEELQLEEEEDDGGVNASEHKGKNESDGRVGGEEVKSEDVAAGTSSGAGTDAGAGVGASGSREEKSKFSPQEMLERFRSERKYPRNESWLDNYKLLSCKSQPFLQRLSILGEFFIK